MRRSTAQLTIDFDEYQQAVTTGVLMQLPPVVPAVRQSDEVVKPLTEIPLEIPQWLIQWRSVANGQAQWSDWTFQERTCKGWLLPWLYLVESHFWGRWEYWTQALMDREWPRGDIPQIHFGECNKEAMNMLRKCLERFDNSGVTLRDFQEWLLWGFGESMGSKARISDQVNEFWYRTFSLGPIIQYPFDYLGEIMSDGKRGYWKNPNGFYPTPHHVVELMVRLQVGSGGNKTDTVCDPCVGTGRMLLHASNISFRLYGMDIDHSCVMATIINGYLYAPWMVKPMPEDAV